MTELTIPKVDFSSLAELPRLYREVRTNASRNALLSELGANPDAAGLNALALRAAQSGDLVGANAMATLSRNLTSTRARPQAYGAPVAPNILGRRTP